MQKEDDLSGDDLKHYEADIEVMNLILISIPNDIYNSVDACTTAQAIWQRVERLMRGIVQNEVDRETRFNNEFDQFVVEPGEALVTTTPYYVTHPSSVVDYDDDYQGDEVQNTSEDPLTFVMILLSRAIMMRFLALGWHLEEIHVTWAHLEKKQTRLRTYTKSLEELCIQRVETASRA
ncbi:hypothetical protein Tco_0316941 [Tanacetum coccineum]